MIFDAFKSITPEQFGSLVGGVLVTIWATYSIWKRFAPKSAQSESNGRVDGLVIIAADYQKRLEALQRECSDKDREIERLKQTIETLRDSFLDG